MIDSHAHLTDVRLSGEVEALIERAREQGLRAIVTIGTKLVDSREVVALAARHSFLRASVGIHPHSAGEASDEAFTELRELAAEPGVVAIGETGLDYYYDNSPRDVQQRSFERHLALASELDLPVVVHARDADEDVIGILRSAPAGLRGVLHCFSSGRKLLETGLDLGWYASFSGMITFSRYADVELLRLVPLDRLLVETDSPYLSPAPHRGRRNEPANVVHVARRAAELREEPFEVLAEATTRNALDLYRFTP
jgi:TatD DNase family protein